LEDIVITEIKDQYIQYERKGTPVKHIVDIEKQWKNSELNR
jgi:hypothetical protein